ncbi:hypothetical protein ARMSODRAFT_1022536 [Armillaria solidipes]|uniref:Peptidase C14 caspase domain-containing protein n=1 Tax=Armillaria solidipes TaxID=1076256 RepID=A0A2H3BKN2_9AGAR|nr:hypothetical protein ARMSODRAFT_1022536 [Armillaria solidipes]
MSDSESQPMSEDRPKVSHKFITLWIPHCTDEETSQYSAAHRVDATQFWAVLIGINAYPSSPLRGCVSDVEKMEEFLTKDLGVLEGRIECLLSTNPIIQHGDNIIIYFSGHGSSYDLSISGLFEADDISGVGPIEALCPMDRTASGTDSRKPCIPDISDREINNILAEISRAKGNHITLILDCCHSSGASREPNEPLNMVRRAPSLPATSIKDMLDAAHTRLEILPKYHSVFKGNWKPDMTSHVVLAACTETQHAKEAEGAGNHCNGIFTQALIGALKSDGLKEESTYVDLITISASMIPPNAKQTPMVAGDMYARRLWYQPDIPAVPDLDLAPVTTPTPTPQPEMSKKVSSWPGMHVWLLNVVGVGVGVGIGLIAWLRG